MKGLLSVYMQLIGCLLDSVSFLPFFSCTERPRSIRAGGGGEQEHFLRSVIAQQGRETG